MIKHYPINLNLRQKKCLVAGAGRVAERKVRRLLECDAKVLLISPDITTGLKSLAEKKKIIFKNRRVRLADLRGAYLVISAAGNRQTNGIISAYCRRKGILVNVVDSPAESAFTLPAVTRRGNLTIAVSTDGISPALSRIIRLDLERKFGAEYARLLRILRKVRPRVLAEVKNAQSRKTFFRKAVRADILNLLKRHKIKQAREKIKAF